MKAKAVIIGIIVCVVAVMVGIVSAQDGRGRPDNPPGNRLGQRLQNGFMGELRDILTEATGLTPQEIWQQVEDGSTLAAIIEANGGSVEDVAAQVGEAVSAQIEEALANENLTEAQGNGLMQGLEERVTNILNRENLMPPGLGMRSQGPNLQARLLVRAVAEATDLDVMDVVSQFRDGATLATILTDNGADVNSFVDEKASQFQERLDEQVANGNMSQAVEDARLKLFRVELQDRLNRTMPSDSQ